MEHKIVKEKLYQIILDLEAEQAEITNQIQNHEDEILQAKKYLQSLYEKEDIDVKIFSPRNVESRYQGDIKKGKDQVHILEKKNQSLYHNLNVIKKRLMILREVWEENDSDVIDKGNDSAPQDGIDDTDITYIVQALNNDRKKIAGDLHDTIVQDLVHMIHKVELCSRYMDQDLVQAKLELLSIEKNLRETIQKARNFISDLRPMIFDDFGFRETIVNAIEEIQKNTSMEITADIDELNGVNNDKCIVLYRVAIELLRNAVIHSGGSHVSFTVKKENDVIRMTVEDDGHGFCTNDDTDKHFGLELVRERVYLIGGTTHIDSTDQGTCVQIIVK